MTSDGELSAGVRRLFARDRDPTGWDAVPMRYLGGSSGGNADPGGWDPSPAGKDREPLAEVRVRPARPCIPSERGPVLARKDEKLRA